MQRIPLHSQKTSFKATTIGRQIIRSGKSSINFNIFMTSNTLVSPLYYIFGFLARMPLFSHPKVNFSSDY